jgi:hypothetical protein
MTYGHLAVPAGYPIACSEHHYCCSLSVVRSLPVPTYSRACAHPLRHAGGSHVGGNEFSCWGRQQGVAGVVSQARIMQPAHAEILGLVQQANLGLNLTVPGNECPYKEKWCKGLPYAMPKPEKPAGGSR